MAYTGLQFKKNFDRRIDKSFSDYYPPEEEQQFYNRVVQLALDSKYKALNEQKRFDELRGVLGANKRVNITNGSTVYLQPISITGYNFATGVLNLAYEPNVIIGTVITVDTIGSISSQVQNLTVTAVGSLSVTVTGLLNLGVFRSGNIKTPQMLTDYMHLFSLKVGYELPLLDVDISGFEATPQFVNIIFEKRSKFRDGDSVIISGVVGTTNANGLRYLKQTGQRKYQLFTNAELTTAVLGNGNYISGGSVVTPYVSKQLFQLKPEQLTYQDEPSHKYPRFRIDSNSITVVPSQYLKYVEFDYMLLPKIIIDPTDDNSDLLLYYPLAMLEFFIDFGAPLFDLETRNSQGYQFDMNQSIMNQ